MSSDSAATSVDREWTERDTLDRVRGEGESRNIKKMSAGVLKSPLCSWVAQSDDQRRRREVS